jgi:hypothetical protein
MYFKHTFDQGLQTGYVCGPTKKETMRVYRIENSEGEILFTPLDTKEEYEGFLAELAYLGKYNSVTISTIDISKQEYDDLDNMEWSDLRA